MKQSLPSLNRTCLLVAIGMGSIVCTSASAVTISDTRQLTQIETSAPSGGPYFSSFFTQSQDGSITFQPQSGFSGSVQAGTAASTTSSGTITVVGNSTSVGGWIDGNKIPVGVTLSFDASFTVSTPTAGSYLTLNTTTGNGIGITQTAGSTGTIGVGEVLNISAISLSSVNFSGTIAESGFDFVPGSVSNPSWYRFRSNNFDEAAAGALMTVGSQTWGFGLATGNQGSGLFINNNYNVTTPSFITEGPLEITMESGVWNLKGLAFRYGIAYDVVPVPEPGAATLGLIGGLVLLAARRKQA